MNVVATVEARMTSSRLPGKVLTPIEGRPALERLAERLLRAKKIGGAVIATTRNASDDPIADWASRFGLRCYRGSEEDVMGRVAEAAEFARADVIVEVTGDCPLLDPSVIDLAVSIYESGRYDVVSNTWEGSYPQGIDAQVFGARLLREAASLTSDLAHREHVSLYFYEHPERYRIHHFKAPGRQRAPHLRFQLDYPEDLEFIRSVYRELYSRSPDFSLDDILDLLERAPGLKDINSGVAERPLRE